MSKPLTTKIGKAIWNNLDSDTQWRIIKASSPIITAALFKSITRTSQKLLIPGAILAGSIIIMIVFSKR